MKSRNNVLAKKKKAKRHGIARRAVSRQSELPVPKGKVAKKKKPIKKILRKSGGSGIHAKNRQAKKQDPKKTAPDENMVQMMQTMT